MSPSQVFCLESVYSRILLAYGLYVIQMHIQTKVEPSLTTYLKHVIYLLTSFISFTVHKAGRQEKMVQMYVQIKEMKRNIMC